MKAKALWAALAVVSCVGSQAAAQEDDAPFRPTAVRWVDPDGRSQLRSVPAVAAGLSFAGLGGLGILGGGAVLVTGAASSGATSILCIRSAPCRASSRGLVNAGIAIGGGGLASALVGVPLLVYGSSRARPELRASPGAASLVVRF